MNLDPRTNVFRPDLADLTLRDTVVASAYVEPVLRQCLRGVQPLLLSPRANARQVSQIRYGEFLDVFEANKGGFAWVQNRTDRMVGYVQADSMLGDKIAMMSNRVTALRSFVYDSPDCVEQPVDELTLGSFVSVVGEQGRFLELANGGFIFSGHVQLAELAQTLDYTFTAGRLLHTPYLQGGRTPKGIDAAGLVQLALGMAGLDVPRDCDQQRESFGRSLECHWRDRAWKRGDIVFFYPDHVGIMTGSDHIIHASEESMTVTVEPLCDLINRGNEVCSIAQQNEIMNRF